MVDRLTAAADFAARAHAGQTRKGTEAPYFGHLLRVSGWVLEYSGDVELAVAGLLHDTLEDCPEVAPDEIERRFGARVREIVETLSDTLPGDTPDRKSPWRTRKERYLTALAQADRGTRLVAACDKLDNLASLVADLEDDGVATFERFNSSARQARWYYESVLARLGDDLPSPLRAQLARLARRLAYFVPEASPER